VTACLSDDLTLTGLRHGCGLVFLPGLPTGTPETVTFPKNTAHYKEVSMGGKSEGLEGVVWIWRSKGKLRD